MTSLSLKPLALAAALLAAGSPTAAQDLSALVHAHLVTVAAQRGLADVEINVPAPDARLNLTACPAATAGLPAGSKLPGRVAVEVDCPGQWRVRLPARVRAFAPVLVTARALARGDLVTSADVRAVRRELGPPGRQLERLPADQGARRPLGAGTVIGAHDLKPVRRVRRGEDVTVAFAGDGFQVQAQAVALRDGARGDRIAVRAASGRTLHATVTGPGAVQVP